MNLTASYALVTSRLERRRNQANAILSDYAAGMLKPWEHRFLSESLLSNLWIDWNAFVKQVLIASCKGSTTRSGVAYAARPVPDNGEQRITHEVQRYTSGAKPSIGTVYTGPQEPTWARPDKIISCINGLAPLNQSALQNAFGSANMVGPTLIHQVRNSCAHKSRHNRAGVFTLRAKYAANPYKDPVDIIWGTNPATNSIAVFEWIADLEDIADLATT
jgi:hypothetical protein